MATILAHKDMPCRQCGMGKDLDQALTGAKARELIGALQKQKVAQGMGISPQYLGDLMSDPPRRPWNNDLAEKFEATVNVLRGS